MDLEAYILSDQGSDQVLSIPSSHMIATFTINLRFTISILEKKDWSRATKYICPICGQVWFTDRSKTEEGVGTRMQMLTQAKALTLHLL